MTATELRELESLAERLARAAGAVLLGARPDGHRSGPVETKSSSTDLVTATDRESERLVVAALAAERPGDGILAEEESERPSQSGLTWVIDPLDGTTNFVYGRVEFAVSIAVRDETATLAAAVYDPVHNECFSARHGGGARRNGLALRLQASSPQLSEALIGTGFSYDRERRAAQGRFVGAVLRAARDVRRGGSAALDLCAVACGRLDGYYEADLREWDLAGGALVATEAGARLELVEGLLDVPTVVCAHPGVIGPLIEVLKGV